MSEEIAAAAETPDPAALSLALAGASREEADAFLRDQRHHLHEQLKQIHLDIFEKWLGVALRLATLVRRHRRCRRRRPDGVGCRA